MTSERHIYIGLASNSVGVAEPAGLLKLQQQRVLQSGEFASGRRYLALPDAHALNPEQLPLRGAVYPLGAQRLRDGEALPLTLRDALPDSWGRKVLEAQNGRPLSDVDALLLANEDRVGAMVFSEALPIVMEGLRDVATSTAAPPQHPTLEALAEATFLYQGHCHLAKFEAQGDEVDMALLEAASLQLAKACGINTPAHHVQPLRRGHVFRAQRFGRLGPVNAERRLHYLSTSAWLNVPCESHEGSYAGFAQNLHRSSATPEPDLQELCRRLVFKRVLGNSDADVKNHGVLYVGRGLYRLAPAFDLVPQRGGNLGYQEPALLPGQHDSSLDLAVQAVPQIGLTSTQATAVIRHTLDTVARDGSVTVRAVGGDPSLARRLADFWVRQAKRIS